MSLRAKKPISIPFTSLTAPLPPNNPLHVTYHSQGDVTNWCWAACAQMIFHFFSFNTLKQCDLAKKAFYPAKCCQYPKSSACNRAYYPKIVFDTETFPYKFHPGRLTEAEVHNQIEEGRPVEILWKWNDAGPNDPGHLLLIIGTYPNSGTGPGEVEILDPREDAFSGRIHYDEVVDAGGDGMWRETFYNLNQS